MRISIPYHKDFLHAELDKALVEAVIAPKAVEPMQSPDLLRKMNILPAASISDALKLARKLKGEAARLVILPDGVAVIPDIT